MRCIHVFDFNVLGFRIQIKMLQVERMMMEMSGTSDKVAFYYNFSKQHSDLLVMMCLHYRSKEDEIAKSRTLTVSYEC